MKWFLEEKIEPYSTKIEHGDSVLFFGSCFSENIVQKGQSRGLHFLNSKFGTIFHPIPIARILAKSISTNPEISVFKNLERFYTWDASTKWNGLSKTDFETDVSDEFKAIGKRIKEAKYLFLTFGTSKEYALENGTVVANCHKQPADVFTSKLTELSELTAVYKDLIAQLKRVNPKLEIVLTVSPVRHSKDGLVTNNRSKARLLILCEELTKIEHVSYFPSYEMVLDELRDYRFYGSDLVHPSDEAVEYVWQKFGEMYFSKETKELMQKVVKYRTFLSHRSINAPTEKEKEIYNQKAEEIDLFLKNNPKIYWK